MTRRAVAAAFAITAAAVSAGCNLAPLAGTEITIRESHFLPARIVVPAGRPVTIVLRNEDPIDHEWIVGDAGVHTRHRTGTEPVHGARATEVSLPALTTRRTTVTFGRSTTLAFVCHLPGHEAYGMTGTLRVA